MPELITIVIVSIIMLFSGFMQTITGFGFALIAVPLLAFVLNPKDVVILVLITGIILKVVLILRNKQEGSFHAVAFLFFASIAGSLPGAYILKNAGDGYIKILMGIVLLATTIIMYKRDTLPIGRSRTAESFVGAISGFLSSTTSMSGPPIILYYLSQNEDKNKIRANLARYFILGNLCSLILSYYYGTFHFDHISQYVLLSIPSLLLSFWLGEKVFYRLNESNFKNLALGIIFISGVIMIINSIII